MENEIEIETVHNIHLRASKIELTRRRKNAPLIRAQIQVYRHLPKKYCRVYGSRTAISDEMRRVVGGKLFKLNKYSFTRICTVCGESRSNNRNSVPSGCILETDLFIQDTDQSTGVDYIHLFCSDPCKTLFEINPLAYESLKDKDDTTRI